MNRVCALSVIFLFGSLAVIAQPLPDHSAAPATSQSPAPLLQTKPFIEPHSPNTCPAGIKVKQEGIPRLVYIKAAPKEGPSAGLRITVSNSRRVGISSVQIAVRGYAEGHLTSMAAGVADSGRTGKTLRVALKVPPGATSSTEVWFPGFVSITDVELTGVDYADGSTWRAANNLRCRISPNLRVTGVLR